MFEEGQHRTLKLIVTSRGLEPARRLRSALKAAVPDARIRRTDFRGVFALEATGNASELARAVYDECQERIGHVTAVLETVESKEEPIKRVAARIGSEHIGSEESFCFRLHKRGTHGLEQNSSKLEAEIGGAIWTALEQKHNKTPRVRLKDPDVMVIAEILGPIAAVGISRKVWREQVQPA